MITDLQLISGKTFVLGEYLALHGGEALIYAEPSLFAFKVRPLSAGKKSQGDLIGIHPHSPAGKFYERHRDLFAKFHIEFVDKLGFGGFGASTAQFLGLANLRQELQDLVGAKQEKFIDRSAYLKQDLASYRKLAWDGLGYPPSGYDLLAQSKSGFVFVQGDQVCQTRWPFRDLDFAIVPTQSKKATHEHLRDLNKFRHENLAVHMQAAKLAWIAADSQQFVTALKKYSEELKELGFLADHSCELLKRVQRDFPALAGKGCGALGFDTLFLVFPTDQRASALQYLRQEFPVIFPLQKTYSANEKSPISRDSSEKSNVISLFGERP